MRKMLSLACLAVSLTLVACGGGGGEEVTAPQAAAKALMARAKPLAGATQSPVPPAAQAEQLFTQAEITFAPYFPGHPTTGIAGPFAYRYYDNGVYLGVVIEQGSPFEYLGVYVVGSIFGNTLANPIYAGQLSQFVTVVDPNAGPGLVVSAATNSARNGTYVPQTSRGSLTNTDDIDITGNTADGLFELDIVYAANGAMKHAYVWYFDSGSNIVFYGCDNAIAAISCAGNVTFDSTLTQVNFSAATLYAIENIFPGPATKSASGETISVSGSVSAK